MLTTLLFSAFFIVTIEAKCADLSCNEDFKNEDFTGKTYIIAEKEVDPAQNRKARCGETEHTYLGNNTFQFNVTYQEENGTIENALLSYVHTQKGNLILKSNSSDATSGYTVIGLQRNKYFVTYSCDAKSGKDAVWVHYYKRVNGLNEIDAGTRKRIKATFRRYNIKEEDLIQTNNKDCKN